MIWAAIKSTLNSTLGTPGFVPLDQQINTIASQASLNAGASRKRMKPFAGSVTATEAAGIILTVYGSGELTGLALWSSGVACTIDVDGVIFTLDANNNQGFLLTPTPSRITGASLAVFKEYLQITKVSGSVDIFWCGMVEC